jgi:tRNA/rRNA methyltransferase
MPCIILVNPFLDANIGSVSRAMLNFGLTELRIVSPECDHLSEKSRALAVGSFEILENAKIFSSLSECVSDLQRVAATTVRPRHMTVGIANDKILFIYYYFLIF